VTCGYKQHPKKVKMMPEINDQSTIAQTAESADGGPLEAILRVDAL
jgi:hypothetical protein